MPTSWTPQAVLSTAAAWVWTPYDAETRTSDHATVVISNGRATVDRAEGLPAADLVAHVRDLVGGETAVIWPTHQATEPADLADALLRAGAEVAENLDVIAYELAVGLPELAVPADVEVRRIDTAADLADAYPVTSAVFAQPEPTEAFRDGEAVELAKQVAAGGDRRIFRYLAYADGVAIGHAGTTIEGEVVKLWGGSVLEEYRGRGAYRALLQARLAEAVERGGGLALVKARAGTSSPILRRAGFTAYGREVHYLLRPSAGQPA
ncbi:GNAT family N-acetyltransferase [Phytomonospora sp. NPDC050363]|uniref:GNAT family N-acetyltransferase n=1 Tax=Phytomonospora sp. NPDC050363 TaxID=3155642 RepID=UPI00340A98B0